MRELLLATASAVALLGASPPAAAADENSETGPARDPRAEFSSERAAEAREAPAGERTREVSRGDEPPMTLALALGAVTSLLPFATGVTMITMNSRRAVTNSGLLITEAGFVGAPFVAHGVVGEWRRGLHYALFPALAATALDALVVARPSIVTSPASLGEQYAFVGTIALTIFTSAVGVIDVVGAKARVRSRARRDATDSASVSPSRSESPLASPATRIFLAPEAGGANLGGASVMGEW